MNNIINGEVWVMDKGRTLISLVVWVVFLTPVAVFVICMLDFLSKQNEALRLIGFVVLLFTTLKLANYVGAPQLQYKSKIIEGCPK